MIHYIDAHRDGYGVEPICQVLEIAPSTYYEARSRPVSAGRLRDAELKAEIERVCKENFEAYGIEKVWRQLNREDIAVGRERVARLMHEMGLAGVVRGKSKRTTIPDELAERPADLVDRKFTAPAPNRLWVADLDPGRVLLRGVHHRRIRPLHRGLVGLHLAAHGTGPGRARDGTLAPTPPGAGGAGASLRSRRPVPLPSATRTGWPRPARSARWPPRAIIP